MPVDPQIATILPFLAAAPPLRERGAQVARDGMRLVTVDLRDPATLEPVRSVEETTYPGAEGTLRARVYRPDVDGPTPTVLFLHGGGYVLGSVETHDDHARYLCNRVGATVFSVDYRLAPEHPFPAGYLDCVAAFEHVVSVVGELGGDPQRVGVAGDSAGGNFAAGVAQHAKERLTAQLLIYPGTHFTEDESTYPSRLENAEGLLLTVDDMRWFRESYRPVDGDPRADVIAGDLEGLAPAVVATAELDPLRDEGEAYAALLEKAGVEVRLTRYPGMIHGFVGLTHISAAAAAATDDMCRDFKELLG